MSYESHHPQHHQSGITDNNMLESLSLQLREAEMRKQDAERGHQVSIKLGMFLSSLEINDSENLAAGCIFI